ncbi:S-layer homology domain-containing protein [Bacillus sp. SM2101]|uniref:S-layer homology domain-containing protein n=1 Tax=Bacillus sp. SM2101 TaxID=2805366 RepID=UPI001BDE63C7|nr:S-layer homology domain-containing protein [Bacillus sp. SM2101]
MKKMIPVVLSTSLLVGGVVPLSNTFNAQKVQAAEITSFSDVNSDYWAYKEINYLLDEGIAESLNGTKYMPNDNITRAQAARMLVKALKIDVNDTSIPDVSFPDLSKSHADYPYIKVAVNEGIFKGKDNGNFGTNENLTRAQMAKVIVETFDLEGDFPFSFKDISNDFWAEDYISKLRASEVTTGYSDFTYKPNNNVTRAQMAAFVYRGIKGSEFVPDKYNHLLVSVEDGLLVHRDKGTLFDTDVNPIINQQVYRSAKALLDDEHFVEVGYKQLSDLDIAMVTYGHNATNATFGGAFKYQFYENSSVASYDSENVSIRLYIRALYFDRFNTNEFRVEEKVANKLKDSLIGMFGEDGKDMYDFILEKWNFRMENFLNSNHDAVYGKNYTKKTSNWQVDFEVDEAYTVASFSPINK